MGNAKTITRVYVQDGSFQSSGSLPDITNLGGTSIPRGVLFMWDRGANIYPNWYQYRYKVTSGGTFSSWVRHDVGILPIFLTDAQITSYGRTPSIYIEVRSQNDSGEGSSFATNAACLHLDVADADVDGAVLTSAVLDSTTVTDLFFTTSAHLSDEIDTTAQTNKFVTANEKTGAGYAYTHLDAGGLNATAHVDDVAASDVADWAAQGKSAYDTLAGDVGAGTVETTAGSQTKVDARLSSTEKTNLQTGLGVALSALSSDTILIKGTHENVTANASTIKGYLSLGNVENKTGATIMADELDNTALLATTDALLVDGANDNVIAGINASAEATKIAKTAIATVKASSIQVDGSSTALFNSSGEMLDATVIGTGSSTTAADVAAAINSSGYAVQLDLTGAITGDLDDIPDGTTYEKVTADEHTQLEYIESNTAFNSSGELLTGIYSSASYGVAAIATACATARSRRDIWAYVASGGNSYDDNEIDITATGPAGSAFDGIVFVPFTKTAGDNTLYFRSYVDVGDNLATLVLTVRNEADTANSVSPQITAMSSGDQIYSVSTDISGLTNGTRYFAKVQVTGTAATHYKFQSPGIYATTA